MTEQNSTAHSGLKLAALTASAFIAGSVIVMGAVLPVGFGIDPTGLGRIMGLSDLEPKYATAAVAMNVATRLRSDTVEITLTSEDAGREGSALEYKVALQKGAALVYEWSVEMPNGDEFYSDFHAESAARPVQIATYKQQLGSKASGALVAPFTGVHGWYFQNQSVKPVVVRLRISGFYDLIPPGQNGNLTGIQPLTSSP